MIYGNALMPGGSGKAGATLTVSAPLGSVITISKDGERYSSSLLPAVFKGLSSGVWTRTATLNGQTSEKFIQIVADYADTVEYFAATINVTFPAGSAVECRQGDYVISTTNTSGSHVFTVPNSGTWTISCTDGTNSTSQNVEITANGQSVSVELSYELHLITAGVINPKYTLEQNTGSQSVGDGYLQVTNTASRQLVIYFEPIIDITPYTTMHLRMDGTYYWRLGLASSMGDTLSQPVPTVTMEYSVKKTLDDGKGIEDITLDVTNANGNFYVCGHCQVYSWGGKIYDWWFE